MGQAYVAFARDNPALFRLMFSSGLDRGPDDDLKTAADAAFAPLVDAALREAGEDPFETALAAWALVHGLAHLLNDSNILSIDADKAEALVASDHAAVRRRPASDRAIACLAGCAETANPLCPARLPCPFSETRQWPTPASTC